MRLLDDLDLPPDSRLVLILAWKLRAATQCEFTRDEFMNGFTELGFVHHERLGMNGCYIFSSLYWLNFCD